jgi:hypothetical protein
MLFTATNDRVNYSHNRAYAGNGERKSRMTRMVLLVAICAILAGCVTHGKLSTLPKIEDLSNVCGMYIIRESSFIGGGISYTVALDYQDFVAMASGDYTNIKVSSGPHIITVKYPRQMFLGTAETSLEVDCKSNTNTYLFMSPGFSVDLSVLSDKAGAKLVQESNYIDLK